MSTTDPGEAPLARRIAERADVLTPTELMVAEYLRARSEEVLFATAEQLAKAAGTSDATVIRTAKALGYSGLPELKHDVGGYLVRVRRPAVRLAQRIEHAGESAGLLDSVFAEAAERLAETRRLLRTEEVQRAVDLLAGATEVVGYGVGISALVAEYLTTRLTRVGVRARAAGATGFRLADELLALAGGDVLVIYAPGRMLPELDVILDHAAEVGARVVLVSDSLGARLGDRVTVALPAVHSGSGLTGECLASTVLTDTLVLGVAARDEHRSTAASDLLTGLRGRLSSPPPRRPRVRDGPAP
ncbi:MurR/RpiR family transcriptional regulator [Pseudonocardia acaciae]|uniref:MurR/RpiR family transcriptional regulator n=1 Tax=Pseudonocardia acaciae TaxID=551276 RepID=UPI000490D490|nr:MurR/RpiR family transcriptional regulator [Pseudonocardia acaciae]